MRRAGQGPGRRAVGPGTPGGQARTAGRSSPARGPLGERTRREGRGKRSIRTAGRSTGCRSVRPGPPRGPPTAAPASRWSRSLSGRSNPS